MVFKPNDWSVVVVGRWNRAILTPAGIGKRIFNLPEGTPLEVLIAIDTIAPSQVKYDGITVIAGSDRLIIRPEKLDFDNLAKSQNLAKQAIESLPETPILAVGINIKFESDEYTSLIEESVNTSLDDRLSDSGFEIKARGLHRAIVRNDGLLNMSVGEDDNGKTHITFNFELKSDDISAQKNWLGSSAEELKNTVEQVLTNVLQIDTGEFGYDE